MYKQSVFSSLFMTPEGFIFQSGTQPYWDDYLTWSNLGNLPEYIDYFPGELEAEQERIALLQEFVKYSERELAGTNYFYEIMAKLRYDEFHQSITSPEFKEIQLALNETTSYLRSGQWDIAKVKFEEASFPQIFMDRYHIGMQQKIDDYILISFVDVSYIKQIEEELIQKGIANKK